MDIIEDKGLRNGVLFAIALSTFMATIDASVVNIALPVISKAFSVGIGEVSWIVTAYLLSVSALMLLWGRLSCKTGYKRLYLSGIVLFALGSLLCGISSNLGFLVFSRIVQGIGASITMSLAQGMVTAIFPSSERGRALGLIGTVVALGSLTGPSFGGMVLKFLSWQWLFFINLPIAALTLFLCIKWLPDEKPQTKDFRFDGLGALLWVIFIVTLFLSLTTYTARGISLGTLGLVMAFCLGLGFLLVRLESKHPVPILPLTLFQNPKFSVAVFSAWLSYATMYAYLILMPFYLQQTVGLPVVTAGLLMSVYPLVTAVVAPLSGYASDRLGFKPLTVVGMCLMSLAFLRLSFLTPVSTVPAIAASIAFLGLSTGLFQSPNTSSIMGAVQREQLGIAGGMSAFFRNFGMVSGTALAMLLFTAITHSGFGTAGLGLPTAVSMLGFSGVLKTASALCGAGLLINLLRKA